MTSAMISAITYDGITTLRITYKLCVLMHNVDIGCSPAYLNELVTSELPSRRGLRSASSHQSEVPRTKLKFRERAFSFAGPAADWNALTPTLSYTQTT